MSTACISSHVADEAHQVIAPLAIFKLLCLLPWKQKLGVRIAFVTKLIDVISFYMVTGRSALHPAKSSCERHQQDACSTPGAADTADPLAVAPEGCKTPFTAWSMSAVWLKSQSAALSRLPLHAFKAAVACSSHDRMAMSGDRRIGCYSSAWREACLVSFSRYHVVKLLTDRSNIVEQTYPIGNSLDAVYMLRGALPVVL